MKAMKKRDQNGGGKRKLGLSESAAVQAFISYLIVEKKKRTRAASAKGPLQLMRPVNVNDPEEVCPTVDDEEEERGCCESGLERAKEAFKACSIKFRYSLSGAVFAKRQRTVRFSLLCLAAFVVYILSALGIGKLSEECSQARINLFFISLFPFAAAFFTTAATISCFIIGERTARNMAKVAELLSAPIAKQRKARANAIRASLLAMLFVGLFNLVTHGLAFFLDPSNAPEELVASFSGRKKPASTQSSSATTRSDYVEFTELPLACVREIASAIGFAVVLLFMGRTNEGESAVNAEKGEENSKNGRCYTRCFVRKRETKGFEQERILDQTKGEEANCSAVKEEATVALNSPTARRTSRQRPSCEESSKRKLSDKNARAFLKATQNEVRPSHDSDGAYRSRTRSGHGTSSVVSKEGGGSSSSSSRRSRGQRSPLTAYELESLEIASGPSSADVENDVRSNVSTTKEKGSHNSNSALLLGSSSSSSEKAVIVSSETTEERSFRTLTVASLIEEVVEPKNDE